MSSTTTEIATEDGAEAIGEIRRVLADAYDAFATGDASAWTSRFTHEHQLTAYGTDPAEFWSGREQLTAVADAQTSEMSQSGMSFRGGTPVIDRRGDVAWVVDQPTLRTGDGAEVPMRLSLVLTREQGSWCIAHFHLSVGVPNETLLDTTLTV